MDVQHIRAFVAVAETGRMSDAAKRLKVTQPAVSLSIAQLERELRASLFHRAPAGLTLTAKGEQLLPKARMLLATANDISAMSEDLADDLGALRIAGRPGFLEYVFPLLERRLRRDLPNVHITSIHSAGALEVVDDVRLGRADLGFAASPGIKSIVAEVIFRDPVWVAVGARHPLARKRNVEIKDLRGLPICIPVAEDRLRPTINALLKKIGMTAGQAIETNDYTLMKNMIAEGEHIGFIYAHMLLMENSGRIKPLDLKEFQVVRDLTSLHRRDDIAPHVARARAVMLEEGKRVLAENVRRYLS